MKKSLVIAQHDFLATIKRKGYILMTFGMPLVFGLIGLLAVAPTYLMLRANKPNVGRVNVVDRTDGLLSKKVAAMKKQINAVYRQDGEEAAKQAVMRFVAYKLGCPIKLHSDEETARKELMAHNIDVFYVLRPDYMKTGKVQSYTRDDTPSWVANLGTEPLRSALIENMLSDGDSEEVVERVKQPMSVDSLTVTESGAVLTRKPYASLVQQGLPYAFGVLLMLCIFMTSGYLLQSLTEEKGSRILELLLSTVTPKELLIGKLLGLGGAGFLQFLLWLSLGITPILAFTSLAVGLGTLLLMSAYFILGFVLFGCLTFSVACMTTDSKESQQIAGAWALVSAVPLVISPLIVGAPNAMLARMLSLFPLTSPVTMILRLTTHETLLIDIPASLAVLAGSIALLVGFASNLLRLSMATKGRLPGLGEILMALRV